MSSPIPEPSGDYTAEDFDTSTERVQALREKVLSDADARAAYDELSAQVAERIGNRKARLGDVRRAVGLTQAQLAADLGMSQGDLSKLERRENLHLSTLSRFIQATGGQLRIVAVFGDTQVDLAIDEIAPATDTSAEDHAPASAG